MANSDPPPPPAEHRFTKENAAHYGARGAAERERRFLQRVPTRGIPTPSEQRRRLLQQQRRELRVALRILHATFGPPWRPRKRPSTAAIVALAPVAADTLNRLVRESTGMVQLRAAVAILDLGLFREPPG
jgi:hypothetical protein